MKQNKDSTGKTWKYLKGIFRSKHQKGKQTTDMHLMTVLHLFISSPEKNEHAVVLKKRDTCVSVQIFCFNPFSL